ncbi:myotubularin-related protein 3 isoform X1 [Triplophysa rosa]|uniref:myotubularin-related protein 3 isoform X1 n=1 Tax=Triplophysa rosa TaxID=992332 RepID=UPI0025462659|nr:myotubularin-related protein 3 isoform X1 [Triplophysa rosa]
MVEEDESVNANGSPDLHLQHLQVSCPLLNGERVEYEGATGGPPSVVTLTNYRLHIRTQDDIINVPVQLVESVECRDMTQLHLTCKDCKVIRCHFLSAEQCQDWSRRINASVRPPVRLEEVFAFALLSCSASTSAEEREVHDGICRTGGHQHRFKSETERMGFHTHGAWRISNINHNYRLCSSYPQQILVPASVTDQQLENVAAFRSWKRIPAVVYRHQSSGAVIGRCGQPEVSWWGWRNADDEHLVQSIAKACAADLLKSKSQVNGSCVHHPVCDTLEHSDPRTANGNATPPQKLLIMDARSYAAAVANRAKGGGCECPEYYPGCEVMFMGMANIHSIRRSFQCLRTLCAQVPDPVNWLSALESTKWLQHLSLLLKASLLVVNAVDRDHRPVLVHCSDGWDRTPQIVALSKLLLDPFYRTIKGFQVLVETEWLDYGHKFAGRCGHGENADDVNERCPVFLQWLDCVHQLQRQFPCSFEFNEPFLVKLVQHTYSCLFGTFLCNSVKEREERRVQQHTCSVWSLLRPENPAFHNFLYSPRSETVLHPVCHVRNLMLWSAVYLPNSAPSDESCVPHSAPVSPEDTPVSRFPKTRSCDDLPAACESSTSTSTTQNHSCGDPNRNDRRVSLDIVMTTESDRNSSEYSAEDTHSHSETTLDDRINCAETLDGRLPGNSTEGAELCMETEVSDTSAFRRPEEDSVDSSSSDDRNVSAEDQTSDVSEDVKDGSFTSTHDDGLHPEVVLTSTPGHDLSRSDSRSVSENSTPQTPEDVCAPDDGQTTAAGDASHTKGVLERGLVASQRLTASGHMDKDGPSLNGNAVQERLRQMETGNGLQMDMLKLQKLWSHLHVNRKLTSLPDAENNMESGCLPRCGTEALSESGWEQMETQDSEVTQWYPDHPASRCYGCERRFWLAARTHHCSGREAAEEDWNCGNVFCASCCDQKAAQNQQLCESKHTACQVCYRHLRPSAVPPADLELEKPITASSN